MPTFYLRKPITINGKNTYVYCRHNWKNRKKPPSFDDSYANRFIKQWGDGKYQFLIYKKGTSTRLYTSIRVSGNGWRGMVKGHGKGQKRYKRYRKGYVDRAKHCDHCFIQGAKEALAGVKENEDHFYEKGYVDGAEDTINHFNLDFDLPIKKIRTKKFEEEDTEDEEIEDEDIEDEEIENCPKCNSEVDYDEEDDLYYCTDENCGWEED